jgi:hypothetical protein
MSVISPTWGSTDSRTAVQTVSKRTNKKGLVEYLLRKCEFNP